MHAGDAAALRGREKRCTERQYDPLGTLFREVATQHWVPPVDDLN